MKKILLMLTCIVFLLSCNYKIVNTKKMEEQKNKMSSKEPKVTGVGGIFFFSNNPKETRDWYAKNLGFEVNDYGSSFESRNIDHPDQKDILQWTPFKNGSKYFLPSEKDFMVNYRVQNIEALVDKLKQNGVTIVDSIATYDYGKFVHIMDADGNKLELWEPADGDGK